MREQKRKATYALRNLAQDQKDDLQVRREWVRSLAQRQNLMRKFVIAGTSWSAHFTSGKQNRESGLQATLSQLLAQQHGEV